MARRDSRGCLTTNKERKPIDYSLLVVQECQVAVIHPYVCVGCVLVLLSVAMIGLLY